jgi:hypothetical protein
VPAAGRKDGWAARAGALSTGGHRHRVFLGVLAVALVIHLLAWIAFYPALFFPDSWSYLGMAWGGDTWGAGDFVALQFDRPSGYPIFLWVLGHLTAQSTAVVTAVQHLLGVLAAVLLYVVLVRLEVRRGLATAACALILFDAYLITLAEMVLADVLMLTLVMTAVALIILPQRIDRPALVVPAAAAGLLLGFSVTVRTATMFLLPVVFVYLLWDRRRWFVVLATAAAVAAPVIAYLTWHERRTGTFSFTQADGWFLYARIGEIGECGDADIPADGRRLCPYMRHPRPGAAGYLWESLGWRSPAKLAFGVGPESGDQHVDDTLRQYAVAIIRDRPAAYARMVATDVLRYFEPGAHAPGHSDTAVRAELHPSPPDARQADMRRRWAPSYDGKPNLPRAAIDAYARGLHTPRPVLGVGILVAGAMLLAGLILPRRIPLPHRREGFLLLAGGLALLVGATATSEFVLRYAMPALPLLWGGIAVIISDTATRSPRAERGERAVPT